MATSKNKCTGVRELDPVEGLVDYINDIKPYHTKTIEVLIEYVYGEDVDVTIIEDPHMQIDMMNPADPILTIACDDGYSARPYGGSALWPVVTPNPAGNNLAYPYGFNFGSNSFTVPGNRAKDLIPGTKIELFTFIEDYSKVYELVGVNPGPAGSGYFLVDDPGGTFGTDHPITLSGSPPTFYHQVETFGSASDDSRPFTITDVQPHAPGVTRVEVAQAVLSTVPTGKLGLIRTPHDNSGEFTVVQAVYSEGMIDSWPGYPDPSFYKVGDDPHTVVTVSPSFVAPTLTPYVGSPPMLGDVYVGFMRIKSLEVEKVLSYSDAIPTITSSPLDYENTPDEGLSRKDIIGVVVSTLDIWSIAIPNTGKIIVPGNWQVSNIYFQDKVRIIGSTGNNGTYTIASITYNETLDQTTLGVVERIRDSVADGIAQIDIPSNVFIIDGNYTSRFTQGKLFDVVGGTYSGNYTTLNSDYVNGKTRIRVTKDIIPTDTGRLILGVTTGFVIRGDFTLPGSPPSTQFSKFNIVGSNSNDGSYTVLSSSYDALNDETTIVPNEAFVTGDTGGKLVVSLMGMIKDRVQGYGESSDLCTFNPEGIVRVKFDEQLTFTGLGIDLYDDIIAYNLENSDAWGYELPLRTIIDPVTPTMTESLVNPTVSDPGQHGDLWFNTQTGIMFQWVFCRMEGSPPVCAAHEWKPITTAWWLEEGPMMLYYRTRNKFVDTGWVLFLAAPPGFSDTQPAIGETVLLGREAFTVGDLGGGTPQTVFDLTTVVVPSVGSPAAPDASLIKVTVNGVPANFTLVTDTQFTIAPVPDFVPGDQVVASVYERSQDETNAHVRSYDVAPHQVFHNNVEPYPGSPQQNAYVLYGGNYIQRFTPDHSFDVWSFSGSPIGLLATQHATTIPIVDVDDETGLIIVEGDWLWLFVLGRVFSVRTSENNYNDFVVDGAALVGSPPTHTAISVVQPDVVESPAGSPASPNQWFWNPGIAVSINNVTNAITIEGGDVTSSFPSGMKVLISDSTANNNIVWTVDTATYYPAVPGSPTIPAKTIIEFVEDVIDHDPSLNARVHTPIFQNYSRDLGVILGAVYDPVVSGGSTDQPKTFVVPSTPVEIAVNGITYTWIGPLRIDLQMSPQDLIYTTMAQRLGATTASSYEIVAVDTGLNQFTIYYESLGSPPAPIDLTDSFHPGTQFFITGSYNQINNQSGFGGSPPEWPPLPWTVVSATFDGTNTIINVAEDVADDTVPYGRIQLQPLAVQPIVGGNYLNIVEANIFEEGSPLVPVRSRFGVLGNQTGIFVVGEQVQVVASAGNDRMWTVTRVYYDGAGEEPLVAIQGSPANQFVISGFYQDKFIPGFEFALYDDGGSPHNPNVKNYTTISSSYDGGLNQTTITVLGEIPDPTVYGDERIRFDGTNKTYLYVDASVIPVDQTTPLGRVVVENTTAGQVAAARFEENIDFGWGTTYQWPIVSVDVGLNEVVVSGDATHVLFALDPAGSPYDPNDVVSIVGSVGSPNNDGTYEVVSHSYDNGTNTTTIVLDPPITASTSSPGNGVLRIENIDITNWFQYLIKEALPERGSPPAPVMVFEVHGNATGDVQLGQQFRVMGTSNDGLYTVTSSPIYDALTKTTDVPVASISNNEKGGWIESARDFGIRLILEDTIGVGIAEDATGALLLTAGNVMDAWDYPYWDIGSWDEDLGTVIHLYSNTF